MDLMYRYTDGAIVCPLKETSFGQTPMGLFSIRQLGLCIIIFVTT